MWGNSWIWMFALDGDVQKRQKATPATIDGDDKKPTDDNKSIATSRKRNRKGDVVNLVKTSGAGGRVKKGTSHGMERVEVLLVHNSNDDKTPEEIIEEEEEEMDIDSDEEFLVDKAVSTLRTAVPTASITEVAHPPSEEEDSSSEADSSSSSSNEDSDADSTDSELSLPLTKPKETENKMDIDPTTLTIHNKEEEKIVTLPETARTTWSTLQYRHLLGVLPIGSGGEGGEGLEMVIIERPLEEVVAELPGRWKGGRDVVRTW